MADRKVDICLLLEGTYPYVAGGVSSWVHELVCRLSEFTFAVVVLLPKANPERRPKYAVPDNVKVMREIYLHEIDLPDTRVGKLPPQAWDELALFHECPFNKEKMRAFESVYRYFFDDRTRGLAPANLPNTRHAWDLLSRLYQARASDESFIDYFWTFRFMHYPLFKVLAAEVPPASVYHTVSTGYAGFLGAIAKVRYRRPLVLTEHGIYTRERRIEISRADWIFVKDAQQVRVRRSQSRFKDLWNTMFTTLSRICYDYSDAIITLYRGNQKHQLEDGAQREKMMIIPNGVDVETLMALKKEEKSDPDELVLGFMGRVVSIKDVKTFIRACKGISDRVPKLKAYIMGPTDEEPAYYEECVRLVEFLGLKHTVVFTGKVDIKEYYPKIDILVLTSISEAQPLVILEAHCLGIPAVATDVGACRELLYGGTQEDRQLGKSGYVVGVTNSEEVANAVLRIWSSPGLRLRMGQIARERVRRFYNRRDLEERYRELYTRYMVWKPKRVQTAPSSPEELVERDFERRLVGARRF